MRPGIMEPRDGEDSCALLGSHKRERGTSGQGSMTRAPEQSLVVGCSAVREGCRGRLPLHAAPTQILSAVQHESTVGSRWG
jgi:hypothetical protein